MVNLESIDPLKVDFRVPEIYMRAGAGRARRCTITLDALPGKTYRRQGARASIRWSTRPAARSSSARRCATPDTSLRPGHVRARAASSPATTKDALVVPEQAIVPQGDEQYVFRVVDGKAARVKVEIGQRRDGKVEIAEGPRRRRHRRHRRPAQAARRHAGDDRRGSRAPASRRRRSRAARTKRRAAPTPPAAPQP